MPEYDDDDTAPVPPAYVGQPAAVRPMVGCVMSLNYRETVDQFLVLQLHHSIDGTAVISCPDRRIPLRIHGEGGMLGVGIPNRNPFRSVNGVTAGNIEVRLPSAFEPKQLEGTYHSGGVNVLGFGGGVSPWINDDASLDFTLYLPTTLDLSIGFKVTKLELRLM